jgi:hypothetical protein
MPKAVPKRTFLLRKDTVATKGVALEVTSDELKKFKKDLLPINKK